MTFKVNPHVKSVEVGSLQLGDLFSINKDLSDVNMVTEGADGCLRYIKLGYTAKATFKGQVGSLFKVSNTYQVYPITAESIELG